MIRASTLKGWRSGSRAFSLYSQKIDRDAEGCGGSRHVCV